MHTQVLIAGAGPTGLMMACQLRLMGISCIILDAKESPTVESRALVIQARSLEIYEQMGIADEAITNGAIVSKVHFNIPRGKIASIPFTNLGKGLSQFPHMLVFEQNKNEELLYKYLKEHEGDVLWKHELISFQQDAQFVTAIVKRTTDDTLTITADFLIAADGAGSTVRHNLGLAFEGSTYEHIFYVADTAIPEEDSAWPHDGLSLYFSRNTFLGLFPMQGQRRFRAIGALPEAFQDEHPKNFDQIAPLIQGGVTLPIHFQDTRWFSVYRLHHRCVKQFRVDRIFLCGDAAHIHSPAGGQGMNTGLQDAYNLAWKLAFVLKGQVAEKILDSYQQERLPIARRLMITTDRAFGVMTSKKVIPVFLRMFVVPYLVPLALGISAFKRFAFRTVSQIEIKYPHSLLTVKSALSHKLRAGNRFPYIPLKSGESFYDKMRVIKFHLLIISNEQKASQISTAFSHHSTDLLETIVIEDKEIAASLNIKSDTLILVRPDHYIACAVPTSKSHIVEEYLLSLKRV